MLIWVVDMSVLLNIVDRLGPRGYRMMRWRVGGYVLMSYTYSIRDGLAEDETGLNGLDRELMKMRCMHLGGHIRKLFYSLHVLIPLERYITTLINDISLLPYTENEWNA